MINQQGAEWRLTTADPIYMIGTISHTPVQQAIDEVAEAIKQLDLKEKKPNAVTGCCIVQ